MDASLRSTNLAAAADLIRTCDEPFLFAWHLCQAAGFQEKHLSRLRCKPEIVAALTERGWIYSLSVGYKVNSRRDKPGPHPALFTSPEWLRSTGLADHAVESAVKADRAHAERVRASVKASRREFKARKRLETRADRSGENAIDLASIPLPPKKPASVRYRQLMSGIRPAAALIEEGSGGNVGRDGIPPAPVNHEADYQRELVIYHKALGEWEMRLPKALPLALRDPNAIRRAHEKAEKERENAALVAKWEAERPQREAEARKKAIDDLETKTKFRSRLWDRDKIAAKAAYAAGLVAKLDPPDPRQLALPL
jgi:hypothetical protein